MDEAGRQVDATTVRAAFDRALPEVYGYLFAHVGGSREVAEDLTQETLMAAVVQLRRGKAEGLSTPWLMAVAHNKLVDYFRRQASDRRKLSRSYERPDEEPDWDGTSTQPQVLAALASLPVSQRAALTLHYLDGLPVRDVARALRLSVHAAESLLARGRAGFKRHFLEMGDV